MAEFVFRDIVKRENASDRFFIASAATSSEEIGNPVHYGTRNKLRQYGISTDGKYAVKMTRADYDKYDYLIGMEKYNLKNMERITGGDPDKKISRLLDFTDSPKDIADPCNKTGKRICPQICLLKGSHAEASDNHAKKCHKYTFCFL